MNNTPPRILTRSLPDGIEDEFYQVLVEFEEDSGAYYRIRSDGVWLTIDERYLTWRPGNGDNGIYFLEIEYDDNNGGIDYVNLILNVTPVDDSPVIINSLQNIDMLEDTTYILDLNDWVLDPDDELNYYSFQGN